MTKELFNISRNVVPVHVYSHRGGFAIRPFVFMAIVLVMVTFIIAGCTRGRIIGDFYISDRGGYQFRLPGANWKMVGDGWKYRSELGYRTVYVEETYKYITRTRETIVNNRRVAVKETTREIDEPAHMEQRDVFRVDTAFVYGDEDVKIIVATARMGDLFRYVRDYGVYARTKNYEEIAGAYFELYPSIASWKHEYRLTPEKKVGGSAIHYLELRNGGEVRNILAGRVMENRLILAYYRTGDEAPASVLDESRRDFMALITSIVPFAGKAAQ